jgi:2-(1,2-epoxy-1,2-dihydrophenyl)acetyl-CoA isomerase
VASMQPAANGTVDFVASGGIASIFLNRPSRLNAVVPALIDDLCAALDRAVEEDCRAVILGGRGRAFCAGHDLKEDRPILDAPAQRIRLQRVQDVTRRVRQGPFVVIAAVHGYALGAGCEFALCSDLIVAAEDAVFGFPEVRVGLSVTGGISHILPTAIGLAKAKELVLLSETIKADEAARLGLVNRVVAPDRLLGEAQAMAEALARQPRQALLLAKALLDRGPQGDMEAALEMEITVALALSGSMEAVAAADSFRKRSSRGGA